MWAYGLRGRRGESAERQRRVMEARFRDRAEAGRDLADRLRAYAGREDARVLGVPRGGVPVAWEVARALGAPLDALVVRRLAAPGIAEVALGAIAAGGIRVINEQVAAALGLSEEAIAGIVASEARELNRREGLYRGSRPPIDVAERTAIVVDDGLATGASMRAAIQVLRARGAARIVVAVPVAAAEIRDALRAEADELVCALTPRRFISVGAAYRDFRPPSDDEVRRLLKAP